MATLVLSETKYDEVPVIIEDGDTFPFAPGERDDWEEATDLQYARYQHYWNAQGDAEDGLDVPGMLPETFDISMSYQ